MRHVLFVCNQNAGRSQMAQAFFEREGPEDIRSDSAGTTPAREVHPEVVEVMREVGIDIAGRKPRKLSVEMQLSADWAITMGCGDACPYVATRVEDWDLPDPAGRSLDEIRLIRDEIERRVGLLIAENLDAIRTNRTAHQIRLIRLLGPLDQEFGETFEAEVIRACADEKLARYEDAAVKSFALTLAHRETRECLRAGLCGPQKVTA